VEPPTDPRRLSIGAPSARTRVLGNQIGVTVRICWVPSAKRGRRLGAGLGRAASLSALLTAGCASSAGSTHPVPGRPASVAHDAYGLQVSTPVSWATTYFDPCPTKNTLNIAGATFLPACTEVSFSDSWVGIYSTAPGQPQVAVPYPPDSRAPLAHSRTLVVNGLRVIRLPSSPPWPVAWEVPIKRAVVIGSGPKAAAILRTLRPATRHAVAAPSIVSGHEYLEALAQVAVSGPVTIANLYTHASQTTQAINGGWWATLSPGTYIVTGHDGNAACKEVTFSVPSGLRVLGPTIRCQGF
jgi:hypothetical protein